jgi:hypothetical protein
MGSKNATEISRAHDTATKRYRKKESEESRIVLVASKIALVDSLS